MASPPIRLNNVYVTDMDNHRIQKFDSDGNFITKWGSEGDGDGQFSIVTPGVDVDSSGYVYVIDKEGANVQKFDSDGNFITKWGSEGDEDGQFSMPEDIVCRPIDQHRVCYRYWKLSCTNIWYKKLKILAKRSSTVICTFERMA